MTTDDNLKIEKKLICRDRKSLAEFFDESPFWEELLNLFAQVDYFVRSNSCLPLNFLNEVRWRCVYMNQEDMHFFDDDAKRKDFVFNHMFKPDDSVLLHVAFKTFKSAKKVKENPPVWLDSFEKESNGGVRKKAERRGSGSFFQLIDNAPIFDQTWDFDFSACPEVPEYISGDAFFEYISEKYNLGKQRDSVMEALEPLLSLYTNKWEQVSMFNLLYQAYIHGNMLFLTTSDTSKTPDIPNIHLPLEGKNIEAPKKEIPEIFQTDEAKEMLEKLRQAKWLDEKYQPVRLSNAQKGLIAATLLKRLDKFNVNTQWQLVCEGLWGMVKDDSFRVAYKQVYGDNLKNLSRQNQEFLEKVEELFED